jgi:hypothetical protein
VLVFGSEPRRRSPKLSGPRPRCQQAKAKGSLTLAELAPVGPDRLARW